MVNVCVVCGVSADSGELLHLYEDVACVACAEKWEFYLWISIQKYFSGLPINRSHLWHKFLTEWREETFDGVNGDGVW